jgi:hypothetical protein
MHHAPLPVRAPVNTLYVIAVMTSLNCGVDVLCLRAIELDATGQRAQTYSSQNACIVARDRLVVEAQRDPTHPLKWALKCVPADSALAYSRPSQK